MVPGQCLGWSDGLELDVVGIGFADQVEGVVDLLAVERLVLQRLESGLADPRYARESSTLVRTWCSSGSAAMKCSSRRQRNGLVLSVTSVIGAISPVSASVR